MRVRSYLTLSASVLLVAAAACSELTGPKSALTADESAELAKQLGSAIISAPTSESGVSMNLIPSEANRSAAPTVIHIASQSIACPRGGTTSITVDITANVNQQAHTMTADVTGSQLPNNCGFLVRGHVVYVTATEPLSATAHVEYANGLPTGVHTVSGSGSFTWSTKDGRGGSCTVDYDASTDYVNHTVNVSGSFCSTTLQAGHEPI
jgi:hypothetical protein